MKIKPQSHRGHRDYPMQSTDSLPKEVTACSLGEASIASASLGIRLKNNLHPRSGVPENVLICSGTPFQGCNFLANPYPELRCASSGLPSVTPFGSEIFFAASFLCASAFDFRVLKEELIDEMGG